MSRLATKAGWKIHAYFTEFPEAANPVCLLFFWLLIQVFSCCGNLFFKTGFVCMAAWHAANDGNFCMFWRFPNNFVTTFFSSSVHLVLFVFPNGEAEKHKIILNIIYYIKSTGHILVNVVYIEFCSLT